MDPSVWVKARRCAPTRSVGPACANRLLHPRGIGEIEALQLALRFQPAVDFARFVAIVAGGCTLANANSQLLGGEIHFAQTRRGFNVVWLLGDERRAQFDSPTKALLRGCVVDRRRLRG